MIEGLNFQTREILASAACLGAATRAGHPGRWQFARNPGLVQGKADALGLPVDVPDIAETTAQGAAMLAGLGAGDFADIAQAGDALTCSFTEPIQTQRGGITTTAGSGSSDRPIPRSAH